jgi:hypothetical protein
MLVSVKIIFIFRNCNIEGPKRPIKVEKGGRGAAAL